MMQVVLDGVTIRAEANGQIRWMSDWARYPELARKGLIKVRDLGLATYGDAEFTLA